MLPGDGQNGRVIGRPAEHIDRDHRLWPEAHLWGGRDGRLQAGGVHVEGVLQHIHEHRGRAAPGHHLGRGHEGVGRNEHRVARPGFPGHQGQGQGVRAAGADDGVAGAAKFGQSRFKFRDLGAHDETAVFQHPRNGLVDFRLDPPALRLQIDEWNGFTH